MKNIELHKQDKAIQRNLALKQGYYDGRFRSRVVIDKRKEQSRTACRGKIKF